MAKKKIKKQIAVILNPKNDLSIITKGLYTAGIRGAFTEKESEEIASAVETLKMFVMYAQYELTPKNDK